MPTVQFILTTTGRFDISPKVPVFHNPALFAPSLVEFALARSFIQDMLDTHGAVL